MSNKINTLLNQSESFAEYTFMGMFSLSFETVETLSKLQPFINQNIYDAYAEIVYMLWDKNNYNPYDFHLFKEQSEIEQIIESESLFRKYKIFSSDDLYDVRFMITVYKKEIIKYNNRKYNLPRIEAQKYIGQKDVRAKVFELHGKKCLKCGTTKNISIDHIKPVFLGGKNEIDNLQPLCRSCNSSKGINEIDYR